MSHSIHLNQLPAIPAEFNDETDSQNISRALRFLEEVDYEEEALRLRRRRRAQRAAGAIAGFNAVHMAGVR